MLIDMSIFFSLRVFLPLSVIWGPSMRKSAMQMDPVLVESPVSVIEDFEKIKFKGVGVGSIKYEFLIIKTSTEEITCTLKWQNKDCLWRYKSLYFLGLTVLCVSWSHFQTNSRHWYYNFTRTYNQFVTSLFVLFLKLLFLRLCFNYLSSPFAPSELSRIPLCSF